MHCAGFSTETYDRYVLGLLEEPDRSQLEAQIHEQCPACLTGVQRSMNLWLVFAETLENAEPSEDFRGRIVRIAELSRKVLTFPKNSSMQGRPPILTSTLLVIGAVTSVLLLATWYAGRTSVRIDAQPETEDLEHLTQELATSKVKLEQETEKRLQAESQLGSAGRTAVTQSKNLADQLSKAQADVEQYKSVIDRTQQQVRDNTGLVNVFSDSGLRLLPMTTTEAGGRTLAYVLFAEKRKLTLVASNLPKAAEEHMYQLWILRREDPKVVSGGLFRPSDNVTVVTFDEAALLSNVSAVIVTDEPGVEGSSQPSATRVLEVSTLQEE